MTKFTWHECKSKNLSMKKLWVNTYLCDSDCKASCFSLKHCCFKFTINPTETAIQLVWDEPSHYEVHAVCLSKVGCVYYLILWMLMCYPKCIFGERCCCLSLWLTMTWPYYCVWGNDVAHAMYHVIQPCMLISSVHKLMFCMSILKIHITTYKLIAAYKNNN